MLSTFVPILKNQVLVRNLVSSSVTAAKGKDMIEMYVAKLLKLIVKYWTWYWSCKIHTVLRISSRTLVLDSGD